MADRTVETEILEVPEMPEILENVLLFALDEAKEKLAQSGEVIPFTCLVVKDNLFIETHPGENPEQCFNAARHTVQGARGAGAYALCYDGYIETDQGDRDALIAEGGVPGADEGHAICYLYTVDESGDGSVTFEEDPAYVGEAPNFMIALKPAGEYSDAEVAEAFDVDDIAE